MRNRPLKSKKGVKVSIIVPAYNCEKMIDKCLLSLLSQTFPQLNMEIIVVDNGSSDQTKRRIQKYPVQYIYESTPSVYSARNKGAKAARGDLLAFIDSDCIADKDWIKNGVAHYPAFQVIAGIKKPMNSKKKYLYLFDKYILFNKNPNHIILNAGNFFIEKSLFCSLGKFPEGITTAGDSLLLLKARSKGIMVCTARNAIVYHPVSGMRARISRAFREGYGSDLKDRIKFGDRFNIHYIFRVRISNLINMQKYYLLDLYSVWRKKKLTISEIAIIYQIYLFLTILMYYAIVIAKIRRKLKLEENRR